MKPGTKVLFLRTDGKVMWDTTRGEVYQHETLLEPYARNTFEPAILLMEHSWTFVKDIITTMEKP